MRKVVPISPGQEITRRQKVLTESEDGEEDDEESRPLHDEGVEIEREVRKVVSSKAAENRGETRLVGIPSCEIFRSRYLRRPQRLR